MAAAVSKLTELRKYSACDISDALLKLKSPGAGFLADIVPISRLSSASLRAGQEPQKQIAAASTVLFVEKNSTTPPLEKTNIPPDRHYVDLTNPDTVVVISQPPGQTNAVLGGIMAVRMKVLGAKAVVVDGRVRDLEELERVGLSIYARAASTVGAGAASAPHAVNVPVDINGIRVVPGDIIFADPTEGIVCIPKDKLDEVLRILPSITAADERVLDAVKAGMEVQDAFRRFRT